MANANVVIRAKGTTDKQGINLRTAADGSADLVFAKAGEYLIEVSEAVDAKQKPSNQFYSIISVAVN